MTPSAALQISAIHHRTLAADHIIGHVMIKMDQLKEGRNELVLKSKAHVDTGVVSFSVSGLEWSQPRAGVLDTPGCRVFALLEVGAVVLS